MHSYELELDDETIPQMFSASSASDMAPIGFAGDPYPASPITRSVTMDPGVMSSSRMWASDEHYSKEMLGSGISMGMPAGEFVCGLGYSGQWCDSTSPRELQEASKSCAYELSRVEPFMQHDKPPCLPSDPFFKLEPTTLHVCSQEPSCVGNILLDFLRNEVDASNVKVRHHKFSFKATVSCSSSTCCVKLRMYKVGEHGAYAIEAQCRKGDREVFADIVEMLSTYLQHQPRCHLVTSELLLPKTAVPRPPAAQIREEDLRPLLEMAARSETASAQFRAELASALARAAKNSQVAGVLCSGEGSKALTSLLAASEEDVLLPLAEASYELALRQDASHFFAQHGLMEAVQEKLPTMAFDSLARAKFTQALQVLSTHSRGAPMRKFAIGGSHYTLPEAIPESNLRFQSSGDGPEMYS